MEDSFGYWLAGLADGEGCFGCWEGERKLSFEISFRKDDASTLEYIKTELGYGNLTYSTEKGKISKCMFYVTSIENCLKLVDIFDRYPLRSKKLRDYLIWREIVLMKSNRKKYSKYSIEDRALLRSRALALREVKQYKEET